MTSARRRGRPAPLRWSGLVAFTGAGLLITGLCLQYADNHADATRDPTNPATPPYAQSPTATPPPAAKPPTTTEHPSASQPARPTRLSLPQLGISAPVVPIRTTDGALTPPSDPSKVGWWSAGAQPGAARGTAIITGHTVHDGGGALDHLGDLSPGAPVAVTTQHGVLRYRVATITTYGKAALARRAPQLFDQTTRGRLVLVTCEDWNGQVYLSNVVVVALPMA